ncbi:MAG: methionine biosynthesis protein MetW [Alphaproteobacteria bacterium]
MTHPPTFPLRQDLRRIADLVTAGSRVLDIGCGDGALLAYLVAEKQVIGRGLELSPAGVHDSVSRGLSVIQGDADQDLADYPDLAFDFVILSRTLQAMRQPLDVLRHLVRIGQRAIVSIPNFGLWHIRLKIALDGRMPTTGLLPDAWHDTPNIHLCTIRDLVETCRGDGIVIEDALILNPAARALPYRFDGALANLLGAQGVFILRRDRRAA